MRLDRFLSNSNFGSRKSCKKFIRNNLIIINDKRVVDGEFQIHPNDKIFVNGNEIENPKVTLLMLNKPKGYICSLKDENYPSVINLLDQTYQKKCRIVGRLDQDTTGLLLLTDCGPLIQYLTHPKHNVTKKYMVTVNHILKPHLDELLKSKIDIGNNEFATPIEYSVINENTCYLTIAEGKYHEVKRIFGRFNYDVINLKRVEYGNLKLGDLKEGEYRKLSDSEIENLVSVLNIKKDDIL